MPDLAHTMDSAEPVVRVAGLRSLCDVHTPDAGRILAAAMADPDASVRCVAAEVAGRNKSPEAVFSLILALDDPDEKVRQAAEKAIVAVTGKQLGATDTPERRKERISELRQWWKEHRYGQIARDVGVANRTSGESTSPRQERPARAGGEMTLYRRVG